MKLLVLENFKALRRTMFKEYIIEGEELELVLAEHDLRVLVKVGLVKEINEEIEFKSNSPESWELSNAEIDSISFVEDKKELSKKKKGKK